MDLDPVAQLNAALAGRYEVEREIGAGGMATVYLARDLKHSRRVAVKVLNQELSAVVGRERFLSEINVTANLQHPHLLPLFDSGDADGLLFYVMPYVEGESLRKRLTRERQLTLEDALHIASAVGSALDYAHRRGVIHRDLKPENILFHERDPLVMDFGIALAVSNAGGARVTQAGISLGTPQYMSPEQATGDRPIDARSDIYSLGAVTYEMLAGEAPHTGPSVQAVMARVIGDRPRDLREMRDTIPPHVNDTVMRALAKLPADRFSSAADFVAALSGSRAVLVTGGLSQAALVGVVRELPIRPEVPPLVSRRALLLAPVLMAAAALAGLLGARALNRAPAEAESRFVIELPDSVSLGGATRYRQVALSSDGSRAVFNFSANFPGPLYTRRTGQLSFDIIRGSDSARSMVISPKGDQVLYWQGGLVNQATPLMKVPIEGGATVKIADSAFHSQASWGDNDQVIFRRGDHLVQVSADGASEHLLARPDTARNQGALGWPEFLPGSKAALITISHGPSQSPDSLYLGAVFLKDGKVVDFGVRGLTPHFASGHVLYVSADGQLFARPFEVGKVAFSGEARVIAKDLSVRRPAGPPFEQGITDLAVSQQGTILFTDGGPRSAGGGGLLGFTVSIIRQSPAKLEFLKAPAGPYLDLRASPDGSHLALTLADSAAAGRRNVILLDFATGQIVPLTRDGMSSYPVWSPDGKRVIYRVTNPAAQPVRRFYSVPWDRSGPATVVPGADGAEALEFPGPEGKYVAMVRGDSGVAELANTNSDIFIAPVDSLAAERPLAATGLRERMPRFSPNGKWLAYHENELTGGPGVQGSTLFVRPVPGPGAVVPVSIGFGNTPLWSHDGRTLFYFNGGGPTPLTAAAISESNGFAVSKRTEVMRRQNPGTFFNSPFAFSSMDVLPNGDFVYLTRQSPPTAAAAAVPGVVAPPPGSTSKVIAIVNWLASQHAATPRR